MTKVSSMTNEELVAVYQEAAVAHGEATEEGDFKRGNAAHDRLASAYRELRRRGEGAQDLLLPLLEDSRISVRGWAASHALEFKPELGEIVLEGIAAGAKGLLRLGAESTLSEWRAGRLRFP
jgi:hypothetical protein